MFRQVLGKLNARATLTTEVIDPEFVNLVKK